MNYRLPFPDSTIPTGGTFRDRTPPRTAYHRGTDWSYFKGARGAIPAVCNGRVVAKGWSSIVGWWVEILSTEGDGMYWTYCHMANPTPLNVGDTPTTGITVGDVGATGSAARGAHLHLAGSKVLHGGMQSLVDKLIDPHAYIAARSTAPADSGKPIEIIIPEVEPTDMPIAIKPNIIAWPNGYTNSYDDQVWAALVAGYKLEPLEAGKDGWITQTMTDRAWEASDYITNRIATASAAATLAVLKSAGIETVDGSLTAEQIASAVVAALPKPPTAYTVTPAS
jgi:hypothetical protein